VDGALLAALVSSSGLNGRRALLKAGYAALYTEVSVSGPMEKGRFLENAPVTAKVDYKFYLNVPYANRIFSDDIFAGFGKTFQKTLTAQYTLPNEGGKEIL
jgi:hypothetical protein